MHRFFEKVKYWLRPRTDSLTNREIEYSNISNIYHISLFVCIMQTVTLSVFVLSRLEHMGEIFNITSVISVSCSILLCLTGGIAAGILRRRPDVMEKKRTVVNLFVGVFFSLLLIWGIFASLPTYKNGNQVITFFIVELTAVLFVKMRPLMSIGLLSVSFATFYILVEFFCTGGRINTYNYVVLALVSMVGSVMNYRFMINRIQQKNEIEQLNVSLETIANHDSMTRLMNRYALNQQIPDYLHIPVCAAIGDVNRFKKINDTYGHQIGDDVLRLVADTLRSVFENDAVYRYGGDEFLVVAKTADEETFRRKIDEVSALLALRSVSGADCSVSCSFGIVCAQAETSGEFINMISEADQKLYEEKRKLQ